MNKPTPKLNITIASWSLFDRTDANGNRSPVSEYVDAVAAAGFDAFCENPNVPGLKDALNGSGLRFAAGFDVNDPQEYESKFRSALEIGNGPINCQLCDHDTDIEDAVERTVLLMEEAKRQGADAHLEAHRDTCTETPEKLTAIMEGYRERIGEYPQVNFDFSHPAIIKHLNADNYVERLFENIPSFQNSTLWHMRPFNGHHCQIPITDGNGEFSSEYIELRPFIKQALLYWLNGPRPGNEFWVVPELGPKMAGYGLSCFPNIWEDTIVLGNDIRTLWAEALSEVS